MGSGEHGLPAKGHNLPILLCFLLGNAMLFHWNALLTVEDYFYSVFPNDHPSRVFTVIYVPFALITTLIFLVYEARANTRLRVISGLSIFVLVTATIIIVDLVTKGHGGIGTFGIICFLVACFGTADGIAEGGLVGDLAFMNPVYMQSYNAGLAASGVATTALRMITKVAYGDSKADLWRGALTFFGVSCFVELLGVLLYAFVFPRLEPVKAFRLLASKQGSLTVSSDLAAAGVDGEHDAHDGENCSVSQRLSVVELCKENWDYLLAISVTYILSLSIFPGFLYEDTGKHQLGTWYALTLIALYNVGDFVGRYLPLIPRLLLGSRREILFLCFARFVFIPAFYFTAKYAAAGYMMFLCIILGISNGYLTVCIFVNAPKGYKGPEQNALGNAIVLFLIIGLFFGVTTDWLWLIGHGW